MYNCIRIHICNSQPIVKFDVCRVKKVVDSKLIIFLSIEIGYWIFQKFKNKILPQQPIIVCNS